MKHIETTRAGRIYQSTDFNTCWKFMELFKGELSTAYYDDWLKGIYTVII